MNPDWPNNATFWRDQRVTVIGGAGFLGSFVAETLRAHGAPHIFIPRRQDYDLVQREAVLALLHDARPNLIIHLAARVRRTWVRRWPRPSQKAASPSSASKWTAARWPRCAVHG